MNRISRIAFNLIVVASIFGLTILPALKILSTPTSASARTANRPLDMPQAMSRRPALGTTSYRAPLGPTRINYRHRPNGG
jgi:hypothetical protein